MTSQMVNGYYYSYTSDGKLECVNRASDGATVWVHESAEYTVNNPLTIEFLATNPDLSDKPPPTNEGLEPPY